MKVSRKDGLILIREMAAEVKNMMDMKMNAVLVSIGPVDGNWWISFNISRCFYFNKGNISNLNQGYCYYPELVIQVKQILFSDLIGIAYSFHLFKKMVRIGSQDPSVTFHLIK